MSLFRRQSFRTRLPDISKLTERGTVFTAGKDATGDGKILCSRITLTVKVPSRKVLDGFNVDAGKLGVKVTFVQGVGKRHRKHGFWELMSFSCSGPVQSLEILSRKDCIGTVGGRWGGRMIEDVSIPRGIPANQSYAKDGFVSQRREPPVPAEARRIVKADIAPAAGVGKPVKSTAHPLPTAADYAEPMVPVEKIVVKTAAPTHTNGGTTIGPAYVSRRQWHKLLKKETKSRETTSPNDAPAPQNPVVKHPSDVAPFIGGNIYA